MDYPYTHNDNLQMPLTYQYSKYAGAGFILSWRQQRLQMIEQLPIAIPPSLTLIDETTSLLVAAVEKLRHGGALSEDELLWPLRLLKKFEVSKRLYARYSEQSPFKRQSDSFLSLNSYFLLAEVCLRMWWQQQKSYWLSGLLKLTDTLCTQVLKMSDAQRGQLSWVLQAEQIELKALLQESAVCC